MPLVVGILHQAYSFRDDPSPNSLATKNSLQLLQQAFLFFFFLPALFGPLNDNLEWHCLGLWRRVKKFLWSWQRARRLDKRHQYSTNQRVWENMKKELFIQVKDTHTKKKEWGPIVLMEYNSSSFYLFLFKATKNPLSTLSSTTMMKSEAMRGSIKITTLELNLWFRTQICVRLIAFGELSPCSSDCSFIAALRPKLPANNGHMEINWNLICEWAASWILHSAPHMTFSSASSPPKLDVNDQAEAKLQYEQSLGSKNIESS